MNHLKQRTKLILIFILVGIIPIIAISVINMIWTTAGMKDVQSALMSSKLEGDIHSSRMYLEHYFKEVNKEGSNLVAEDGKSIAGQYEMIDQISSDLNVVATLFVKEGEDYKRILTSIVDEETGERVEGTLLSNPVVASSVEAGSTYVGSANILGAPYLAAYAPLENHSGEVIGIIFVGISQEASQAMIQGKINQSLTMSILYIAVIILLGTIIMLISARQIASPLIELVKHANILAKYNLQEGIPNKLKNRRDEIGILANALQTIEDSLRQMIQSVDQISNRVTETSKELANNCLEASQVTEEMAKTVQEIAQGATNQADSTTECLQRLEVLGNLVDTNQTQMEALNTSSTKVSELAGVGREVLTNLAHKINTSNSATAEAYDSMQQTNDSAMHISEASSMIASIAAQTNLLALNASIEAARAGEYGKGFTVVAEEIRKLAEQSANSTHIIDEQIKRLQKDASHAVIGIEKVKNMLSEQTEDVQVTESKYLEIAQAIKKTQAAVVELTESGKHIQKEKEEVSSHIESLSAVAEENAAATEQSSACIEEQSASIHEMQQSSTTLATMAATLHEMIKEFKL